MKKTLPYNEQTEVVLIDEETNYVTKIKVKRNDQYDCEHILKRVLELNAFVQISDISALNENKPVKVINGRGVCLSEAIRKTFSSVNIVHSACVLVSVGLNIHIEDDIFCDSSIFGDGTIIWAVENMDKNEIHLSAVIFA